VKEFLISPPFGNFLSFPGTTSIRGTFTYERRGSRLYKLWRFAKTVRPIPGGWVNSIGFQNPGIRSIKAYDPHALYSIGAVAEGEWEKLIDLIPGSVSLEINMGCPNLDTHPRLSGPLVRAFISKYPLVVFKLTHSQTVLSEIEFLAENGARYLHLFNTIPGPRGGESGKRVQELALRVIRHVRELYPHITIVGGGGIYSPEDVERYREAGASHFSLSSVFFSPVKAMKIFRYSW
jgi:dihydroorotate dehydrogenase